MSRRLFTSPRKSNFLDRFMREAQLRPTPEELRRRAEEVERDGEAVRVERSATDETRTVEVPRG